MVTSPPKHFAPGHTELEMCEENVNLISGLLIIIFTCPAQGRAFSN